MIADAELKPYFVRAVYQWCADRGHTPFIAARAPGRKSRMPADLAVDGRIVFNIGAVAVRDLVMDGEGVAFTARFAGESKTVYVAMCDVAAIFARETGRGLAFAAEEESAAEIASRSAAGEARDSEASAVDGAPDAPDHLRLI